MGSIKVGFCVSYDWYLLEHSLPRVYDHSDSICLSLDKGRKSWAGKKYDFDQDSFEGLISRIDTQKKIRIIEGNFSNPDLNSRENGNLQRTAMANALGEGGWHIQVDSDEYFIDFGGFSKYLENLDPNPNPHKKPYNVLVNWIPVYKKLKGKYLVVDFGKKLPEAAPFATTRPQYLRARHNDHFNVLSPFFAVHETWARGKTELEFKISNWGHSSEELNNPEKRNKAIELWGTIDESNYSDFKDIHPAKPESWPALKLVQAKDLGELMNRLSGEKLPIGNTNLWIRNHRFSGKIRQILGL